MHHFVLLIDGDPHIVQSLLRQLYTSMVPNWLSLNECFWTRYTRTSYTDLNNRERVVLAWITLSSGTHLDKFEHVLLT